MQIDTNEPLEFRAGDTVQWRREDLPDYPASAWTLTYYFRNATHKFDKAATADADNFAVTFTAADTAALAAGRYTWIARVSDGAGQVFTVDEGAAVILVNLGLDAVAETRSFARRALEAIEAVMEGRAGRDQLKFQIGTGTSSRSLELLPVDQLIQWRTYFQEQVDNEDRANKATRGEDADDVVVAQFGRL